MRLSSVIIFLSLIVSSCLPNNTDKAEVKIIRFDLALKKAASESTKGCAWMEQEFPDLYAVYAQNLTKIGACNSDPLTINQFIENEFIAALYDDSELKYSDLTELESEFGEAFGKVKSRFPKYPLPTVYAVITGSRFPGALVNDSTLLIGLDLYLGSESEFYEGFEDYAKRRYIREHIVPNSIAVIADDLMFLNGVEEPANSTILNNMIYHGKRLALMEMILPKTPDSLLIGYSKNEIEWCLTNEGDVWAYLVDRELLYSRENINMQRIIGDGPFTPGMPDDSPGKIGQWVGWRIVDQYLEKSGNAINEIFHIPAQEILDAAAYRPKR